MVGTHLTNSTLRGMLIHKELTQQMGEVARVDFHRARGSAQAIRGTRLFTEITVGLFHLREPFRILASQSETEHLPLRGDTHP